MQTPASRDRFRFRDFELDLSAYEVRRKGHRLKLGKQPMDLLILLVESRGRLVSRSDIVDRLWGKDVFVDVETGVNTAISKVRQALRDSPDAPAFVETVPGKGYRFIAPVEVVSASPQRVLTAPPDASPPLNGTGSVSGMGTKLPSSDAPVNHAPAFLPAVVRAPETTPATRLRQTTRALVMVCMAVAIVAGLAAGRWIGFSAPAPHITLAVLPFDNLDNPERQYLADGFTDETAASLAQIDPERLRVKGRTLRYKRSIKTVAEIGQELSVDYLVESSIRAEGDRVRVTATLIRVRDQEHVWSHSYERLPGSLLALQREVSAAIAEQVRLKLSPDRLSGLGRRQTQNVDAYDAYLRGRYFERQRTPVANAQAIEHYQRAIALDPDYALAWSSLAFIYAAGTVNSDTHPLERGPLARAAAAHALSANPDLAEVQFAVAYINWLVDWDWKAAEDGLRRAILLDSSNAAAHLVLGHALSQMGRQQEAELSMRRARELDPLDAINPALSAQVSFQARNYPAAAAHARQAILLNSTLWIGYVQLGQAYEQLGETELALEVLADATRLSGGNSKPLSLRGFVLGKAGRTSEAREVLRTLVSLAETRYVPPFAMALVHAGLGEREAVFAWLEKAYAARDIHLIYLPVDPKFDLYRKDPRFQALVARCGFQRVRARDVRSAK
jgi:TolB-like protein/DNA-binding winged helix-turn-helix (wHTH) protein/Flp pilus assembly protein TadD